MTPMDLAAQLNANPKLAALRTPALGGIGGLQPMTPLSPSTTSGTNPLAKQAAIAAVKSPPLLINSQCSGYFLEPVSRTAFFSAN